MKGVWENHTRSTHTPSCAHTYWLEACLRNSSSVCLKVSRRHLLTVFSTLATSPVAEGAQAGGQRLSPTFLPSLN